MRPDRWPPILRDGPSGLLRMRRLEISAHASPRTARALSCLTMSNSHASLSLRTAVLHAAASCGVRVLPSSFKSAPETRGWRSADRRTLLSYVARARRDDRVSETRAVPLQPGRPLGAPSWRFSAGDPRCRLRQWHRSRPATCPHQAIRPDGRGPGPPALRFAPQSRDTTPRSIVRIVSGGRPL
jgi:hypothetical protein